MNEVVLDDIPFEVDAARLMKRLHIAESGDYARDFERVAAEAQVIARPKALYKVSLIESKGDNAVVVDGVTLTSRVLRVNVDQAHRVFPFVATCGTEVDDWSRSIGDPLLSYWADGIKHMALRTARRALDERLGEHCRLDCMSSMAPGRIGDWPIHQQRALFAILGSPEEAIGVRLSKSCLMIPTKSVSGVVFPTETSFESCQLCPRDKCAGRKAPYDKGLYDRRYRLDC